MSVCNEHWTEGLVDPSSLLIIASFENGACSLWTKGCTAWQFISGHVLGESAHPPQRIGCRPLPTCKLPICYETLRKTPPRWTASPPRRVSLLSIRPGATEGGVHSGCCTPRAPGVKLSCRCMPGFQRICHIGSTPAAPPPCCPPAGCPASCLYCFAATPNI